MIKLESITDELKHVPPNSIGFLFTLSILEFAAGELNNGSFYPAMIDLSVPDGSETGILKSIQQTSPDVILLVATKLASNKYPYFALKTDAQGYLLEKPTEVDTLTARETDVLRLIAKGINHKEVARLLGISPHTVRGYTKDIYLKLNINTRAEAAIEALRMGLITI